MNELCPVAVELEAVNQAQAESAAEAFLLFLKKKRLCDVSFVFDNSPEKIEAHQCFLRARSPVFDSMFRGLGCGTVMKEVKIEDASPDIVDKFLQFIYADKFDVTTVQALHLLQLGHKYNVQPLVKKCEALISEGISTENAIEIYETAEKYGLVDLTAKAGNIIARSLQDFLHNPLLLKAKDTTMIALLKRSDLTVKETDLFQLALNWGHMNSSGDHELAVALTDILPNIRFTNMTPQEFTTVVWPTKLIPLEDTAYILAYISGDDSTRKATLPSLKYETSMRKTKKEAKFEKTVMFITEHEVLSLPREAESSDPFKECFSFSTNVSGSCETGKTFKIKSLFVTWPTRKVYARKYYVYDPPPANFRVLVMRKRSQDELYTTKFDDVFYNCCDRFLNCFLTRTRTVTVDPPVEISNEFDYCIAVVDEHQREINQTFTYDHGKFEITKDLGESSVLTDTGLRLCVQDIRRNDCPKACAVSGSYNAVHVIKGICIELE